MVDLDGHRLAVRVTGAQGPAVVMLSSAGGGHEQWEQLRALLGDTLCVSYGRPGIDGSDPLPPCQQAVPRTSSWAADQLHRLLHTAEIPPPYVLAGCSIGGWIADQFIAYWPGEVAGLVQVDPTFLTPIPACTGRRRSTTPTKAASPSPGPHHPPSSPPRHRHRPDERWSSPGRSAPFPWTSSAKAGTDLAVDPRATTGSPRHGGPMCFRRHPYRVCTGTLK
jgi:pimeloyl-ACP methyl ester carboxylesterase